MKAPTPLPKWHDVMPNDWTGEPLLNSTLMLRTWQKPFSVRTARALSRQARTHRLTEEDDIQDLHL